MNLYYRISFILKKISLSFFFISFLYSQDYPNGSFSLDQIFFQLNTLNIESSFSKDSLNNGKISLSHLRLGFDGLKVVNRNNETIKLNINGPSADIEDLKINTNYILPNYYNLILSDLSDNRYETPIDGLEVLEKAIETFKIQKNKYPISYNDLIVESYINSSKYPFNQSAWSYHLNLPTEVNAVTTSAYKYSKKSISLDWPTKTLINLESDQYEKKDIEWNFIFEVQDINQTFLSDITIDMNSSIFDLEFYQKRGKFHINGINIYAIPNKNIFEQTIIRLNNLSLEINDLFFQIVKVDSKPRVQTGKGKFSLTNFELKIPPKLLEDETIAILMKDLGVRNGLIRIRKLHFNIQFYDNEFGIINASFISPFLKIKFNGQMSIDTKRSGFESVELFDSELRINPISYGVRDVIREWEIENNKDLNREGPVIVLKFSGPLKKPTIIGID